MSENIDKLDKIIAEMRSWSSGRSNGPPPCVTDWADRLTAALAAQDAALSAPRAGEDAALAFIREVRESPNTINNADWTQGFHDALDYLLRELPARIAARPARPRMAATDGRPRAAAGTQCLAAARSRFRPPGPQGGRIAMRDFSIRVTRRTSLGDKTHEETLDFDLGQLQQIAVPVPSVNNATNSHSQASAPRLEWSHTLCDGKRVNYAAAEQACAALGEGWRLPSRMELESILDLTRHEPAVDTTRFPDTKSGYYWSSTPCAWSSDYAWIVSFNYGLASGNHRDGGSAFVRAVRGVPAGQ